MLDNILKRKKQPAVKVEAEPSAFDRAALTRRMRDVLDRPTRRELNPPQLSPEDYFQAGYSDAPAIPASIESRLPEDSLHASEPEAAYAPPAHASGHEAAFGEQSLSDHRASGHDDHDDFSDTPVESGYSEARRPVDDVHTAPRLHAGETDHASSSHHGSHGASSLEELRRKISERLAELRGETAAEHATPEPYATPALTHELAPLEVMVDTDTPAAVDALDYFKPGDPEVVETTSTSTYSDTAQHMDEVRSLAGNASASLDLDAPLEPQAAEELVQPEAMSIAVESEMPSPHSGLEDMERDAEPSGAPEAVADTITNAATPSADIKPVDHIYLSAEATDPAAVAALNVEILDYLMYEAGYMPEELPANAVRGWCVNFLAGHVASGGLGAFAYQAFEQPEIWEACAEGLESCGAVEHLDVFDAFRQLLARDAGLATALGEDAAAGAGNAELAEMNEAFAAAEAVNPCLALAGAWLAGLPETVILDSEALQDKITTIGEDPALAARRAEMTAG